MLAPGVCADPLAPHGPGGPCSRRRGEAREIEAREASETWLEVGQDHSPGCAEAWRRGRAWREAPVGSQAAHEAAQAARRACGEGEVGASEAEGAEAASWTEARTRQQREEGRSGTDGTDGAGARVGVGAAAAAGDGAAAGAGAGAGAALAEEGGEVQMKTGAKGAVDAMGPRDWL